MLFKVSAYITLDESLLDEHGEPTFETLKMIHEMFPTLFQDLEITDAEVSS